MEGENPGQQRQEQGEVRPDQGSSPDHDAGKRGAQSPSLRKGKIQPFNRKVLNSTIPLFFIKSQKYIITITNVLL